MDKYIYATNLIKNIDAILAKNPPRGNGKSTGDVVVRAALGVTKQMVQDELKVGEVRPVVHAHWIEHEADFGESLYCECSNCHDSTGIDCTRFCGACGAIMDEQTIKVQDC